jgi:hypothetical protein
MSTQNSSKSKQWFKRIIIILILLELGYLLIFNILLNTLFVQKQINSMEPERFQLQWESAWTPYPTRIHIEKLTARGKSVSKEWQADIGSLSVSLSLLPLIDHHVKLRNIKIGNIAYAEQSNQSVVAVQPAAVQKENVDKTVTMMMENNDERKPWDIELRGVEIHGHHTVETDRFSGELDGDIDTDLALTTKESLLSVKDGKMDIVINTLHDHEGKEMVKQGKIKSVFKISPLHFMKMQRGEWLKYLTFDSDITARMENLDIFSRQLQRTKKIQVKGKGALESQIHLVRGKLLPGTKLQLEASEISVKKRGYLVHGEGKIQLDVTKKNPDILNGKIHFGNFKTFRTEDGKEADGSGRKERLFFHGKGLTLNSETNSTLYSKSLTAVSPSHLELIIPPVTVDDLSLMQQYVPDKWRVELYRGKGMLQGKVNMNEEELNATVKLSSKDAEIGFDEERMQSDLDMLIKMKVSTVPKLYADLTGTHMVLSNTKLLSLKKSDKRDSKTWNTKLKIEHGAVMLSLPDNNSGKALFEIFRKYKIKDMLAEAEGELKVTGDISQLFWVDLLMKSSLDFSVSGSGAVEADLLIKSGALVKKSMLKIRSKNIQMALLDYRCSGKGEFTVKKTEDKGVSGVIYALNFSDATMKREGEKEAKIVNVVMKLDRVDAKNSKENEPLHLQILSAKVKKVSLYNQYFPENSPFVFVDGSADLSADILLESNSTKGYVKLMTSGLKMKIDDQTLSGRLRIDTKIVRGEPRKMKFDISGSTIVLDKVRAGVDKVQHEKDDWSMILKLKKADIVWKKPLQLKSEIALSMKDSRPVVAMMDNKKVQFSSLSKLLLVKDLRGGCHDLH